MFVDASAIVAILTEEPEAEALLEVLESADVAITSPIAVFETVVAIARKKRAPIESAEEIVIGFLRDAKIALRAIGAQEAYTALDAFARFGKGRGHSARLNLGDCFAYAVAKNHRLPILYKGDDFNKTDLRSANRPR
ncbi:MAG TPA: type II toxin-antitoxin system VapC family toxin [Candidatus Binataceae bacterium]|nr:type II toxin-antitoxin system VapC family toxin [Candidatus Binataceae bacterium]